MEFSYWVLLLTLCTHIRSEYIPPGPRYQCPKNKAQLYPCLCAKPGERGVTIVCENTNLASLSVGLKNFANENLLIEKLYFSKCNIGIFFPVCIFIVCLL